MTPTPTTPFDPPSIARCASILPGYICNTNTIGAGTLSEAGVGGLATAYSYSLTMMTSCSGIDCANCRIISRYAGQLPPANPQPMPCGKATVILPPRRSDPPPRTSPRPPVFFKYRERLCTASLNHRWRLAVDSPPGGIGTRLYFPALPISNWPGGTSQSMVQCAWRYALHGATLAKVMRHRTISSQTNKGNECHLPSALLSEHPYIAQQWV